MLDSDIKSYHAAEVSSALTNGGRMSANQIISGVENNVFPHVSRAERLAGSVLHRKIFTKAADDTDGTMLNTWVWAERYLDAADWHVMFLGTQTDTQADITGSERKYGFAFLKNAITAGASTFTVTVHDASLASGTDAIFQNGDKVRLSDMATPTGTGNEEFLTISGTPTVANTVEVTITVAETIANSYAAFVATGPSGAFVVSYIVQGDIACSVANFTVTSAGSGAYDSGSYPVVTDNIGTVEDSVTVSFTDATHFTVTGSSGINYGSGVIGTDFSPTNADFTKPYFTLETAGFSGTWAWGDTITFDTHPAAFAKWLRRTVPASCPSLANNKVTPTIAAESAV